MQKIIIEKPYCFVTPHVGTWWPAIIQRLNLYGIYLRRSAREVVIHPVAIKYLLRGLFEPEADRLLTTLEARLSWQPQRQLSILDRVTKLGRALLHLKELEYFGEIRAGTLGERMQMLIDRLLDPLESEWLGRAQTGSVNPRVKALRMKIMPKMVHGSLALGVG